MLCMCFRCNFWLLLPTQSFYVNKSCHFRCLRSYSFTPYNYKFTFGTEWNNVRFSPDLYLPLCWTVLNIQVYWKHNCYRSGRPIVTKIGSFAYPDHDNRYQSHDVQRHGVCNFLNATVQTLVPSKPANLNFGYVRTWSTYWNKWGWWICFCCAWLSVSGHEAASISPSSVDWQNSSHNSSLVLLHDVMTCIMH